jgi:hypothetical protein
VLGGSAEGLAGVGGCWVNVVVARRAVANARSSAGREKWVSMRKTPGEMDVRNGMPEYRVELSGGCERNVKASPLEGAQTKFVGTHTEKRDISAERGAVLPVTSVGR